MTIDYLSSHFGPSLPQVDEVETIEKTPVKKNSRPLHFLFFSALLGYGNPDPIAKFSELCISSNNPALPKIAQVVEAVTSSIPAINGSIFRLDANNIYHKGLQAPTDATKLKITVATNQPRDSSFLRERLIKSKIIKASDYPAADLDCLQALNGVITSGDNPLKELHLMISSETYAALMGNPFCITEQEALAGIAHEISHIHLNHIGFLMTRPKDGRCNSFNREFEFQADQGTVPSGHGWGLVQLFKRLRNAPAFSLMDALTNYLSYNNVPEIPCLYPSLDERINALESPLCRQNPSLDPDYDFGACSALGFTQCDNSQ